MKNCFKDNSQSSYNDTIEQRKSSTLYVWALKIVQVLIGSSFYSVVSLIFTESVTCLVTDAKLTADPGVASSIPARSHTFVEIDHEIISTVIFLPSAESFMKGCCQLQAKVCARLIQACPGKKCG